MKFDVFRYEGKKHVVATYSNDDFEKGIFTMVPVENFLVTENTDNIIFNNTKIDDYLAVLEQGENINRRIIDENSNMYILGSRVNMFPILTMNKNIKQCNNLCSILYDHEKLKKDEDMNEIYHKEENLEKNSMCFTQRMGNIT